MEEVDWQDRSGAPFNAKEYFNKNVISSNHIKEARILKSSSFLSFIHADLSFWIVFASWCLLVKYFYYTCYKKLCAKIIIAFFDTMVSAN